MARPAITRRVGSLALLGAVLASGLLAPAAATAYDPGSISISLQPIRAGFDHPVLVTGAGDGSARRFVLEQTGYIRTTGSGPDGTPFLDIHTRVLYGGERGLLGLAFHPSFESNGRFYVLYTRQPDGAVVIDEYRVTTNPNRVSPSTRRRIIGLLHPNSNHNGGGIAFGPDGYLYVGLGDGGDGGGKAQDVSSLFGKMLRLDVNGSTATRGYLIPPTNPYVGIAGRDEIWASGLRNPWRWSFDRGTGNLWIGDVGQNSWEEVNRAGGGGRKLNYGWNTMEGRHCYSPSTGCSTTGRHLPIVEYAHSVSGDDNCSVTGGYVYRGQAYPAMRGGYFFADYCSGRIWSIDATSGYPPAIKSLADTSLNITSFGESDVGEIFVTATNGSVYKLVDN